MKSELKCEFHVNLHASYIDVPIQYWTPELSYLVCRALTDEGIIEGVSLIGSLRNLAYIPADGNGSKGFELASTNYAWIETSGGQVIDPCDWEVRPDGKYFYQRENTGRYYQGQDPLLLSASQLPTHYSSDELFNLSRGLQKEVFGRLLELDVEVAGITMPEAAYVAKQPLQRLGGHAKMVYEFLIANGMSKLIPLKQVAVIFPQLASACPNKFLNLSS